MSDLTKTTTYGDFGGRRLFSVNAGVPRKDAILEATCAVNAVKQRLEKGVEQNGIEGDELWLFANNLEAVQALLEACDE